MVMPRERRLLTEFEAMKALRSPFALFDFHCANLTTKEGAEYLRASMSGNIIKAGLLDFISPEEFEAEYPGRAPDKYLITYHCKGLVQQGDGSITESSLFHMEVVFTPRFPGEPPRFIWLTPNIWHPNFDGTYICLEGRSFAVGLTLDLIVPEVGRMVQYQNYNVRNPLSQQAAKWAAQRISRFPIDKRDILDYRKEVSKVKRDEYHEGNYRAEDSRWGKEPEILVELLD